MGEWKEYRLGDFFKIKHGFAFSGKYISEEKSENILITPGNFKIGGGFKSNKFKYYQSSDFPSEYILKEGEIVVTMTDLSKDSDTLGYSAKIPKAVNGIYLHNQRIGLLQFKTDVEVSKDFIYWLLRTREYQGYVVGSASGTSIMHTSPSRIEDYECLFPPLPEQKAIASVLSSLDDKIDLLHRQNTTLEKMAETLFRQWFVEEAKEEWEIGKLGNVVEIKYGKDHNKLSSGSIPVYGSGGLIRYVNIYLYDKESVLIPRKGTLNNVMYTNMPFWTVDTMFYSIMKLSNMALFVFHLLKGLDLASMNVGSAVPSMTTEILNNIPIIIPSADVLAKYEKKVRPLYDKIKSNDCQIRTLTTLRDTLLPKLMSGEVRIEV